MKIAVACENGTISNNLGGCKSYLMVSAENGTPTGKEMISCSGDGAMSMLKMMNEQQIDVLICGALGIAARNALELLGVLLVPGCEGSPEEAVAKFLVGETQGDPTILELAREEDPDDPMNCMHDCSKCMGCGPIEVLKDLPTENK